jgi:hypothetical protein
MELMLWGLAGLAATAGAVGLFQRRQRLLRLQAQVAQLRFLLEDKLRERREAAGAWCAFGIEQRILPEPMAELRKTLDELGRRFSQAGGTLEAEDAARAMEDEHRLSRRIRDLYALFLQESPEGGARRGAFQQDFDALTRLENEIQDAQELYNDSVRIFNERVESRLGEIWRRVDGLAPLTALPSPAKERRRAGDPEQPALPAVRP